MNRLDWIENKQKEEEDQLAAEKEALAEKKRKLAEAEVGEEKKIINICFFRIIGDCRSIYR
ncbi:MAG: hypothetical protein GY950_24705, partial [bacterium]|nr:hypothetical protein [bacterium]